jgi:hypothetical protein
MDELRRLLAGYQVSQAVHVAAVLGVADLLADGPRTSDELAEATGADPDALYRLLRALAVVEIVEAGGDRTFSLGRLGQGLRSDVPDSIADWAAFVGRKFYWDAWAHLIDSVRTGENAFRVAHGTSVWDHRERHPEDSVAFDRGMAAMTRRVIGALLDAYDFGRFGTIVDVGGGNGALLAAILDRHSSVRGVLFDQPHVVSGADPELAARCTMVGGDFFEVVPPGCDAYVLKWIVHDWEDEEARAILRTCRRAMTDDAALLVIERVLEGPNDEPFTRFSDLNMLVGPGGRERTLDEFERLLDDSGFALVGCTPTASDFCVVEAEPV